MIYLSLHCHQRNDSCIKMGSDKSHFNVSLIVRDKVKPDSVHRPQLLKRKERGSGIEQGKNWLTLSLGSSMDLYNTNRSMIVSVIVPLQFPVTQLVHSYGP